MGMVPVLGRLRAWEWPVLFFSLGLVLVESIIAFITFLLPSDIIQLFRDWSRNINKLLPNHEEKDLSRDPELDQLIKKVAKARGFVEMCEIFGYDAEEHIVRTSDGYLLGLHRIGGPKGSDWRKSARSSLKSDKPVVYLHHGLLMNSEVWVAVTDASRSLPFALAEMGYDVWLGNNRGNKYSKKHLYKDPTSKQFWDFSIDDFALFDIPDIVNYVLEVTQQPDLSYIGFSQGSAQGFAALSINPQLNRRVRLFIAVSPAISPPGLSNNIVRSLTRANPSLIYLFFGQRSILKSATFWQSIMLPAVFVRVIDRAVNILFGWKSHNISWAQKLAAYPHLFSYTSVKSVVHWFQIIRDGRFHMYDSEVQSMFQDEATFYRVAPFPTQNIVTPILLIYGKSDTLVNINTMLADLPPETTQVGVPDHEHLDLIWGNQVDSLVFPYIYSALRRTGRRSTEKSSSVSSQRSSLDGIHSPSN